MIAALLLAAGSAALIPAQADAALVVSDVSGLRAMLETAGRHTHSLSPQAMGDMLRTTTGVNLLAEEPRWGLGKGERVLVLARKTVGLSAPVGNAKAARAALKEWLAVGERAGRVSGGRLLTASGPDAGALVASMSHPRGLPKALTGRGPAWLYLHGRPPLKGAVFTLDASATGLVAHGRVFPLAKPILDGHAALPACEKDCLRASLGPSGFDLLQLAFARLGQALPESRSLRARLTGIDARQASVERAVHVAVAAEPAGSDGPAAEGELELSDIATALAKLSPIDALGGPFPAGAYAAHLLYGPLLRNSGPLTLTATPAPKGAADVEIRLPLR